MSKVLSSLTLTLNKCLRIRRYRNYAVDTKRHIKSKDETVCHPKAPSCTAKMGECPEIKSPLCGQPNAYVPKFLRCCSDNRLTKDPCAKSPTKKRKHEEKKPFKSMWAVTGEVQQCPALVQRLDEIHYQPSDKLKRLYTQTWETCGAVIKNKKVCCFEDLSLELPPVENRLKTDCPETAHEQNSEELKLDYYILRKCMETPINPNKISKKKKCKKIVMPCCRKVSKTTKCHNNREKSKCEKECCPYPSFSEYKRPNLHHGHPVECKCQNLVNQCDTLRFAPRKKQYNIPPPLPAWPPKEG